MAPQNFTVGVVYCVW